MSRSTLLLCCFASLPAFASGQLDPTFDADGVATFNLAVPAASSDRFRAGLIDQAGRYVGVGNASNADPDLQGLVARVLPDAQLDASFGSGGIARQPVLDTYPNITWEDVVEQPDGRLVVAGRAHLGPGLLDPGRAYVCRLLVSGALDPGFGDGGCTRPEFAPESTTDSIGAVGLQSDGRIVLAGLTDQGNDGTPLEYVVARLNTDGSIDACFGDPACLGGGVLIRPEPQADLPDFRPSDLAIAPDDRIVIAGRASGASSNDMAVIRLLANGSVDSNGFGTGGHRLIAFDQGGFDNDDAQTVLVRADGSVVISGIVETPLATLAGIAALNPLGAPQGEFGDSGKRVFFFNDVSATHTPTDIVEQADGKLVVVGWTDNEVGVGAFQDDCGIARFTPEGELDPDFASSGTATIDGGLGVEPVKADACHGVALDARRIVLFGERSSGNPFPYDAMIMRLDQDALFADGFEPQD